MSTIVGLRVREDQDCRCASRPSWWVTANDKDEIYYSGQIVSNCGFAQRWVCLHEHRTRSAAIECAKAALACP